MQVTQPFSGAKRRKSITGKSTQHSYPALLSLSEQDTGPRTHSPVLAKHPRVHTRAGTRSKAKAALWPPLHRDRRAFHSHPKQRSWSSVAGAPFGLAEPMQTSLRMGTLTRGAHLHGMCHKAKALPPGAGDLQRGYTDQADFHSILQ